MTTTLVNRTPDSSTPMTWEESVEWLRRQPDQQQLVRDCYFDDPLLEAAERFANSPEWVATELWLPQQTGLALDLGGGRGITSYGLAKTGWRVIAVEPDPSPLVGANAITSLANQSGLPITAIRATGEHIPFRDATFDLVMARQTLHHARDLVYLCKEIARVLKPTGTVVTSRDHVISRHSDLPMFLASHPLHRFYGGENAFLLEEYRAAFQAAGLVVRQCLRPLDSPINYHPATEDQRFDACTRPLGVFVGKNCVRRICNSRPFGPAIFRFLKGIQYARDNSPGRLYSFVLEKPVT